MASGIVKRTTFAVGRSVGAGGGTLVVRTVRTATDKITGRDPAVWIGVGSLLLLGGTGGKGVVGKLAEATLTALNSDFGTYAGDKLGNLIGEYVVTRRARAQIAADAKPEPAAEAKPEPATPDNSAN